MFYINITVYRTSYICSVHVPVCTLWFILTDSIFQGTICCLTALSPLYTFSVSLKFLQYLYWHQFDEHVVICDCIVMSNTYCVMFFVWFVFVLCLVCPMLPISLDCPFLIAPLVFFNVYLIICMLPIHIMTRKLIQWWSTIPPIISTKWTITSLLSPQLNEVNLEGDIICTCTNVWVLVLFICLLLILF